MARFRNCDVLWTNGRMMTGKKMSVFVENKYTSVIHVFTVPQGPLGLLREKLPAVHLSPCTAATAVSVLLQSVCTSS